MIELTDDEIIYFINNIIKIWNMNIKNQMSSSFTMKIHNELIDKGFYQLDIKYNEKNIDMKKFNEYIMNKFNINENVCNSSIIFNKILTIIDRELKIKELLK